MESKGRTRIAAVLAGAIALFVHASAGAQQLTKVRVGTLPILDTAPLHAGVIKGFFREEGIDVDFTPTTSGATGLPAVAAGHLHVVISNAVSTILGYDQGLGFQIVADASASGDAPPNSAGLVARKGSGFKTGRDLEGKRMAVNARNNINWLIAREWAALTGGNPDRITFLEVPFPNMGDALRGKQVDAAYTVEPFLSAGVASGATEIVGWPYDTFMKRVPIAQYASSKEFIAANPGVIERWVRAYNRSVDWANANRGSEEWLKIVAGHSRLTPAQLKNMTPPLWRKSVDPAGIAKMAQLMKKHGLLKRDVDVKGLIYKTAVN